MDWGRFARAMEAEYTELIEKRREAQIAGQAELTPDEWEIIKEHDELMTEWETAIP